MPKFAVVEGQSVIDTIVADSKEIAESVTGKQCIEFGVDTITEPGGLYLDGVLLPKKPYPSWVYNSEIKNWVAPVPYPEDFQTYSWSEELVSWVQE